GPWGLPGPRRFPGGPGPSPRVVLHGPTGDPLRQGIPQRARPADAGGTPVGRRRRFRNAVRGQYGPGRGADGGWLGGPPKSQPSLLGTSRCNPHGKPGESPNPGTETFAAVRLFIDNERWHGIPIYLRSGKALSVRATYAVVEFKTPPGGAF